MYYKYIYIYICVCVYAFVRACMRVCTRNLKIIIVWFVAIWKQELHKVWIRNGCADIQTVKNKV